MRRTSLFPAQFFKQVMLDRVGRQLDHAAPEVQKVIMTRNKVGVIPLRL